MATCEKDDTLESWLNKATDPNNPTLRWECIQGFYEQVNREQEGPLTATRLLAHKIQSPQEKEALQALTLLETCMNHCGKRFHCEATKFRFLNELIKVLSPKYLGTYTPVTVKQKVTEVLYSWTQWLKEESKVQEAYHMLKKQGLIKKDPKLPDALLMPPPSQRTEASLFDDEDKSKLLARLLKSSNPEDLQTANRLIKNTIKEEQEKMERVSRRISTLEEVERSTGQLKDLLDEHAHNTQPTPLMKSLFEKCDKLRPNLFRLASDTVDDDEALAEILQANDKLTTVISLYRERANKQDVMRNGSAEPSTNAEPVSPIRSYHLIDFSALDSSPPPSASPNHGTEVAKASLDDDMVSLGVSYPTSSSLSPTKSYFDELIELGDITKVQEPKGEDAWQQRLTNGTAPILIGRGCGMDSLSQNGSSAHSTTALQTRPSQETDFQNQPTTTSDPAVKTNSLSNKSLADIFVPLETVKPSRLEPITVYDRWGVHVCLHFCCESPLARPDVAVVIVSTVNTSALPLSDVKFQVAVPKNMMVKLQPSSGKDLPPYNPLLPPASISQVLLLANPTMTSVRLRYKLSLKHGDELINELGEVDHFPDWHSWTRT